MKAQEWRATELPPQKLRTLILLEQTAILATEPKRKVAAVREVSLTPTALKIAMRASDSVQDSAKSLTRKKSSRCRQAFEPFADATDTARGKVPMGCKVLLHGTHRSWLFLSAVAHNPADPRRHNDPRQAARS